MLKTKHYNNFPEDSKLNVPSLKKDEVAMFRLVNSFDPASKKYFLRSELAPSEDFVSDPDTGVGYHVACIKSIGVDDKVTFHEVWFEPNAIDIIRLSGRSAYDQEIYKFMKISNFNASNVNRDKNAPARFEEITAETDVILPRIERKNRTAALILVEHMTDQEVIAFLKNNRLNPLGSEELRRNQIEDFAEKFPSVVLKSGNYTSQDMAKDVDKFIDANLIAFSKEENAWYDVETSNVIYKTGKSFSQTNGKEDIIRFFNDNDAKYFRYQRKFIDMKLAKGEAVVKFDNPKGISDIDSDILNKPKTVAKKSFVRV
jgi:hypothetical protein